MALGFGHLYKLHGIVTYRVSPHYLKAFKGCFSHGFPNTMRRTFEQIPYVGPAVIACVGIYYGVEHLHHLTQLKKPGDFDDEE